MITALAALALCIAPAQAPSAADRTESLRLRRTPVVDVFNNCKDAVVNISTTTETVQVQSSFDDFDRLLGGGLFDLPGVGQPRRLKTTSVGSGFVIHRSGYIVTNAHVVAQTQERKVIFADKREYDAEIVGLDAENDLALLQIKPDKPIAELRLGRSDDLMVGETVIAIGNPLGLQHTVTSGVVSAIDRTLEIDDRPAYKGLVQTDASINPGNSGGPLLNVLGELIGVNFAIRGDGQNIGFAIPVDRLGQILPSLIDVERRHRIVTGLEVEPGLTAVVSKATPGAPAATAGLRVGDRLIDVDGQPIVKSIDFPISLIGRQAGDVVPLTFARAGGLYKTSLQLAAKPKPDGRALAQQRLGLEIEEMTSENARRMGLRKAAGLLITKVEEGGPGSKAGVEPDDVLVQVERSQVLGLDDLGLLLETAKPSQPIRVTALRITRQRLYRIVTRLPARAPTVEREAR